MFNGDALIVCSCLAFRECQVAAWKDHKKLCDVMVAAQAEEAKSKAKENVAQTN